MHKNRQARTVLAMLLLLSSAACARNVRVEGEPGGGYAITVRNTLNQPMVVSYDDGSGVRVLGTVLPASTDRFVIASPRRTDISVQATSESRALTRNYPVTLVAGTVSDVVIR